MFRRDIFANSRSDGFGVLEIPPTNPSEAGPRRFVPLRRSDLRGEVFGPLADLRLTQVFSYSREECPETLEALYRFPLPGDAAITGVVVQFDGVEIRAKLAGREQAEAEYESAKSEGRQAALATREAADVFTLKVAGLQPDLPVTVETRFVQLAHPEGEGFTLRIPLTTAPRYVRGDEAETTRANEAQPLALMRDPGHRFSLDLLIRGAEGLDSPTHALAIVPEGDAIVARLAEGEVVPDRDCVLSWKPARSRGKSALQAIAYIDPHSDWVYFLALAVPPSFEAIPTPVAREVVLLVDHSGSMEGAKWEAADWAVRRFVDGLNDQDRFALGIFHHQTAWQAPEPISADPGSRKKAIEFLLARKDSGGTELGVALEQALAKKREGGTFARHLLVVTDAEVTDEDRILRLADDESKKQPRRRISVICIDAAPNAHLALELAERGGGVAEFLTSDPGEGDITSALNEVLSDWAQPVQVGLKLEVNREGTQASRREVIPGTKPGFDAIDLGDLPAGRASWVVGRVPRGKERFLSLWLSADHAGELATARIELSEKGVGFPAIKPLFGARRISALEHLANAHYPEKVVKEKLRKLGIGPIEAPSEQSSTLYPENAAKGGRNDVKALLARESLAFGLISSETAFVATRTEVGKHVGETVVVANAMPAGWDDLSAPTYVGAASCASYEPVESLLAEFTDEESPPDSLARRIAAPFGKLFAPFMPASAPHYAPPSADLTPPDDEDFDDTAAFSLRFEAESKPAAFDVFDGIPSFQAGKAVLFESSDRIGPGMLKLLVLRHPDDPAGIDPRIALLLYAADPAVPRAKIPLADLIRNGGNRPLNIRVAKGELVRIVLEDPAGAWAGGAPRLVVGLVSS